jgi:hypothetical protein
MSLRINPNLEAEIQQRAKAQGVSTEQLLDHLLHPLKRKPQKPTLTMLLMQSWLEEDATDNPEAIRLAGEDLEEFKRNMNQPRKEASARFLYPERE